MVVDETGYGSYPIVDFGVNGVPPLGREPRIPVLITFINVINSVTNYLDTSFNIF